MIPHKDKLWTAYLDGELSAAEAAEFEKSLSTEEKQQLAAEMQFEEGLMHILSEDEPCPDVLWDRVCRDVAAPQSAPAKSGAWFWRVSALAAGVAIVMAVALPQSVSDDDDAMANRGNVIDTPDEQFASILPAFLAFGENSVESLQQQAQVNGDESGVNAFMREHGFKLALETAQAEPGHHALRLIGAREVAYDDEAVLELFYECCEQPMKVIVAKQGGAAAEHLAVGVANGHAQASRHVGDYVAAVVGKHGFDNLVRVVHL
jgi:anti-sigma factor RsiW